jgi:hypothetical protein
MPFYCTICGEESTRICVRCTKDTCSNHLCDRCHKCSDCCECEVFLDEPVHEPVRSMMQAAAVSHPPEPIPVPKQEPEPPQPAPDPDPFPNDEGEPGPVRP